MTKLIDLTGNRYGLLTVLRRSDDKHGGAVLWECVCDCGKTTVVRGGNLKTGAVKSCGCLRIASAQKRKTHGMSKTRLYREWATIKARCLYKTQPGYKSYGGRGIKMCKEWESSFDSFAEWALHNGYCDNLTIERIDNNKGYSPDNCKWIPLSEQANNRRTNLLFSYNGETHNLSEWCKKYGKDYRFVHNRIRKNGWSFERALFEPVHVEKRNRKE